MMRRVDFAKAELPAESQRSNRAIRTGLSPQPTSSQRLRRGAEIKNAAAQHSGVIQRAYKGNKDTKSAVVEALWGEVVETLGGDARQVSENYRANFDRLIRSDTEYDDSAKIVMALLGDDSGDSTDGAGADYHSDEDDWRWDEEGEEGDFTGSSGSEPGSYQSSDESDRLAEFEQSEEVAARHAARKQALIAEVQRRVKATPLDVVIIWTGGNLYKADIALARSLASDKTDAGALSAEIAEKAAEAGDAEQNPFWKYRGDQSRGAKVTRAMGFAEGINQQVAQETEFYNTVHHAAELMKSLGARVSVYAPDQSVFLTEVKRDEGWKLYRKMSEIGHLTPNPGTRQVVMTMGHGTRQGDTFAPTEDGDGQLGFTNFGLLNQILQLPTTSAVLSVPMQCFPQAGVQNSRANGVSATSHPGEGTIGSAQLMEWLDAGYLEFLKLWLPEAGGASASAPPLSPDRHGTAAADSSGKVEEADAPPLQKTARDETASIQRVIHELRPGALAALSDFDLNVATWEEFDSRLDRVSSRGTFTMMKNVLEKRMPMSEEEFEAFRRIGRRQNQRFPPEPSFLDRLMGGPIRPAPLPPLPMNELLIDHNGNLTRIKSASSFLVWLISHPDWDRFMVKGWANSTTLVEVLQRLRRKGPVADRRDVWDMIKEVTEGDSSGDESSDDDDSAASWDIGTWDQVEDRTHQMGLGGPGTGVMKEVPKHFRRVMPKEVYRQKLAALTQSLQGYTLVGIHGTTAENIGSLVRFGPTSRKTGSENQTGKGRGFYIIPVAATGNVKRAIDQAVAWGEYCVAVYLRGGFKVVNGSTSRVEKQDERAHGARQIYRYGAAEQVIPESLYADIRCVCDPAHIVMADPALPAKTTERPLRYLSG